MSPRLLWARMLAPGWYTPAEVLDALADRVADPQAELAAAIAAGYLVEASNARLWVAERDAPGPEHPAGRSQRLNVSPVRIASVV